MKWLRTSCLRPELHGYIPPFILPRIAELCCALSISGTSPVSQSEALTHPQKTMSPKPPSRLLRVATFGGLWAIVGFILYATYQTDVCPPEVKNREAIQAGLLAPVFLSAKVSACFRGSLGELAAGIGFPSAYLVLGMILLGSRTMTQFVMASIVLTILSGLGLWSTFYSYAHSGG